MDQWLARHRGVVQISIAISATYEAAQFACEGQRAQIGSQLRDLGEELVYLHRQLLELPPEKTPAACEFERTDLHSDSTPF